MEVETELAGAETELAGAETGLAGAETELAEASLQLLCCILTEGLLVCLSMMQSVNRRTLL